MSNSDYLGGQRIKQKEEKRELRKSRIFNAKNQCLLSYVKSSSCSFYRNGYFVSFF